MAQIIWLVIAAIMIVLEIISLGLTTIWFAGGALIAALAAWLGGTLGYPDSCFCGCLFGFAYFYKTGCSEKNDEGYRKNKRRRFDWYGRTCNNDD